MGRVLTNTISAEFSRESAPGVPTTLWRMVEPDNITRFGGEITTTPRNPISNSRQRRKGTEDRALATFTQELARATRPDDDLHREICACVGRLARTLKPEYAEVLQAVDVEETPVKTFADTAGLTTSNAGVRLFRAREALRKQVTASCGTCAEHGCLDCSCRKS